MNKQGFKKKRKILSFILISLVSHLAYSGQVIQIAATLAMDSSDANLMLMIDDLDSGVKTPLSMYLHAGNNLQTFTVSGDHYQLIPIKLLAPLQEFVPCPPSAIIDHHALIMTISGKIAANQLNCSYRETPSLGQLYPSTQRSSSTLSASAALSQAPLSSQKTNAMADYLRALSENCSQGDFEIPFAQQKVEYTILGLKSGHCDVTISTGEEKAPLLCRFTADDLAMMASPKRIADANQGLLSYSENDLSAQIMKARCHSL